MKIKLIFLILFAVVSLSAINDNIGTKGFNFFKIKYSPRAEAMANAYAGLSDESDAVFFNSAGLSQLKSRELSISFISYFDGFNGGSIVFALPQKNKLAFGVFSQFLGSGNIEKTIVTDNGYEEAGEFGVSEMIFGAALAYDMIDILKLGMNAKMLYEGIDGNSATAVAVDLSMLHKTTYNNLMLGASIMNLGLQTSKYTAESEKIDLPVTVQIGLSYSGIRSLLLNGDLYRPLDGDFSVKIGSEYVIKEVFKLRAGFKSNYEDWKSEGDFGSFAGMSFGASFTRDKLVVDYAISSYGDLGFLNQIAVKYKL